VSDEAIADRLARLRADSTESRVMPGESHSLAGWQGKFALHWTAAGQWCEALGSAPTTHILKPGVARLTLEALTEHVTMDTAARLGLPAAKTEYTEFAGQPAIVVERYDRARRPDGTVARVHQEDLCQGLGVPPHRKYERLGGPGLKDIFPFLRHTVGPEAEAGFARYLVFHYLSGSSDGHAKNCSIILGPQGERVLAPLYDAASVLYYAPAESQSPHGLAFSVGGEHVFGRVRDRHWRRMARACHVDPDLVFDPLRDLAARLPDAMRDAFRAAGPVAENMAREVMPLVQRLCHSAARDQPW
jgi:serine/threonine-protein kinase HipA